MEGGEDRLYEKHRVRTSEEEHRAIRRDRGWKETPMQQMLIGEKKKIEYTICMKSRAIWPKTVGKKREEGEERKEQWKHYKSWQKTMENSELPTGLLKYVQCIVPRKTRK